MRCTLPSYRRARSTDKKETGNEEGEHRSGKGEQENLAAEVNRWIGSRRSQQLVLRAGRIRPDTTGAARRHECETVAPGLRCDAAQPDRAGNRNAFAVDQSLAQGVGA